MYKVCTTVELLFIEGVSNRWTELDWTGLDWTHKNVRNKLINYGKQTDTIGNKHFVPCREVSLTQGLPYTFNQALSTMWLRFHSFPLLCAGREC